MYSTVSEYFWLFLDWDGSPQRIANLRIVERYLHNRWKLYNVHSKTRTVLHSILPKSIVIKPKLQPSTTTPKKTLQTKSTCKKTGSWQISGLQSLKTHWHQPKAGACHSLCFDWRWNPVRPKAFLVSSLCSKLCFYILPFLVSVIHTTFEAVHITRAITPYEPKNYIQKAYIATFTFSHILPRPQKA